LDLLWIIAVVVAAYLLGAIPFGLLVARMYGIKDIRALGSGNIGATNVWRLAGARAAAWVFLLDIGKGLLAVVLARLIHQNTMNRELLLVISGVAAVLGHVFPVYLGFRGGKGVNTGLGVMLSLLPLETLACVAVFIIVLAVTKFVSVGSIIAAVELAATVAVERFWLNPMIPIVFVPLTVFLALFIVVTHRQNIKRLAAGTENRFSLKSKHSQAGSHV
jgi:acyl phosphate:glycerol-3-phosphate acyltransferase